MRHITQCTDPNYLPFALARIKALRATGLRYASQTFAVGGSSINVRIEGDHEFIKITGGVKNAIYLVFWTPEVMTDEFGATIDYSDFSFASPWLNQGTYTFVKTTPPNFNKFEVVGQLVLDNINESNSSGTTTVTSSTNVRNMSIYPLGFFNGRFVYYDLTIESSSHNVDFVDGEDGTVGNEGSSTAVSNSRLINGGSVSFAGGSSDSVEAASSSIGGAERYRETGSITHRVNSGYMSGNLVRSQGVTTSSSVIGTRGTLSGGPLTFPVFGSRSLVTYQNVAFSIVSSGEKGRSLLEVSDFEGGGIVTFPAVTWSGSFPPDSNDELLDHPSTVRAPAQITLALEDNSQHRVRIALWQADITLIEPSKVNPDTGVPEMFPPELTPGQLLQTTKTASKVFSAEPTGVPGALSQYIYSYAGAYVCTVPPGSQNPWDDRCRFLFDEYMVHSNAFFAIPLDNITLSVFSFKTQAWVSKTINISTEEGVGDTLSGEIPKSFIPSGSYLVRAFRDELGSLLER